MSDIFTLLLSLKCGWYQETIRLSKYCCIYQSVPLAIIKTVSSSFRSSFHLTKTQLVCKSLIIHKLADSTLKLPYSYQYSSFFSSCFVVVYVLSILCDLRGSGCEIGYEPTKMSRYHFWHSLSRDTNVGVSALSPILFY